MILNKIRNSIKIMSFKGTASKSASGASMSKYDVEVEARLKKLEQKVGEINNIEGMINDLVSQVSELQAQVSQLQFQEAQEQGSGGDCSAVVAALKSQFPAKFANL